MWNSLPGGLLVLPEYSTHLAHFPFYYLGLGKRGTAPFNVKLLMQSYRRQLTTQQTNHTRILMRGSSTFIWQSQCHRSWPLSPDSVDYKVRRDYISAWLIRMATSFM